MKTTVAELIKNLSKCNQEADVYIIIHNKQYDFTLSPGDYNKEKNICNNIGFYVDELCAPDMINSNEEIPEKPKPPLSRVCIDGVVDICPKCHSSVLRRPRLFGKKYCINSECDHFTIPIERNIPSVPPEDRERLNLGNPKK